MKKADLEHLIRAAAAITGEYELVIVGSQSILGSVDTPPNRLLQSNEADIYPLNNTDLADLIDGSIGEGSIFHEKFQYYAQGVGPETSVLANGWKDRLIKLQNNNTDSKIGYCISASDLAIAKFVAWREKDIDYLKVMAEHHIINRDALINLAKDTPLKTIDLDELLLRIDIICPEDNALRPY